MSFRKKTWYLHMWKDHCCYGYIINRAFHSQKESKINKKGWCFINVYIINKTLHGRLKIPNFSSRFEITRSEENYRISSPVATSYPLCILTFRSAVQERTRTVVFLFSGRRAASEERKLYANQLASSKVVTCGKAGGKDWTRLSVANLMLCHWSSRFQKMTT